MLYLYFTFSLLPHHYLFSSLSRSLYFPLTFSLLSLHFINFFPFTFLTCSALSVFFPSPYLYLSFISPSFSLNFPFSFSLLSFQLLFTSPSLFFPFTILPFNCLYLPTQHVHYELCITQLRIFPNFQMFIILYDCPCFVSSERIGGAQPDYAGFAHPKQVCG